MRLPLLLLLHVSWVRSSSVTIEAGGSIILGSGGGGGGNVSSGDARITALEAEVATMKEQLAELDQMKIDMARLLGSVSNLPPTPPAPSSPPAPPLHPPPPITIAGPAIFDNHDASYAVGPGTIRKISGPAGWNTGVRTSVPISDNEFVSISFKCATGVSSVVSFVHDNFPTGANAFQAMPYGGCLPLPPLPGIMPFKVRICRTLLTTEARSVASLC